MKKLLTATLLFALTSVAALAADFNGKWTADVPGRDGGTMTNTFTLKVDGAKLTGSLSSQMGDAEITNGKVDGDTFTLSYAGKADGADSIKFTRTFKGAMPGGGDAPPPQEFTAKKAK